jgi:hypothetical protein
MSTNDVPGSNPKNRDELGCGCWAEHEDGSHVFVLGSENDEVVYSMFDISKDPVQEFRDKLPKKEFEKHFSWDGKNIKWTWHDKTPFPWDKIIKAGATDGVLAAASAYDQIKAARSVAQILAEKLGISPSDLDADQYDHMISKAAPKNIMSNIQKSIDECPPGKMSRQVKKVKKLLDKRAKIDKQLAELG